MSEVVEVKVTMKDDERSMTQKFLCYEELQNMEMIQQFIDEAKKNFTGDPESVIVKTTLVIQ